MSPEKTPLGRGRSSGSRVRAVLAPQPRRIWSFFFLRMVTATGTQLAKRTNMVNKTLAQRTDNPLWSASVPPDTHQMLA